MRPEQANKQTGPRRMNSSGARDSQELERLAIGAPSFPAGPVRANRIKRAAPRAAAASGSESEPGAILRRRRVLLAGRSSLAVNQNGGGPATRRRPRPTTMTHDERAAIITIARASVSGARARAPLRASGRGGCQIAIIVFICLKSNASAQLGARLLNGPTIKIVLHNQFT